MSSHKLGLPWEKREVWERISPLNYVENAVTPTLFVGGEKDWNVPIINSELMYQSMKRLGRETHSSSIRTSTTASTPSRTARISTSGILLGTTNT